MSVEFDLKDRNVIPNWRDFKRTLQLEELNPVSGFIGPKPDIFRALQDWKEEKNMGTAADLINCSFISGINNYPEIMEAYHFIKRNENRVSPILTEIAELAINHASIIIKPAKALLEKEVESISDLIEDNNKLLVYKLLSRTRKKAHFDLYNPITWVELARLHSMVGNIAKAEKAIVTALGLAPSNRFVLRSATRFFVHSENPERAIYHLKNAASIQKDPWLISAHISSSSVMGRFSPFTKIANELIESNNFSDFDLTELSSSMGTLQFKDGNLKKAKGFLNKSMKAPNDNTLAQQEWLSRKDHRLAINPFNFKKVVNPFEAYAFEYFYKGQWKESLDNCLNWFLDTPYSKRPASLGSYIAGCLMNDYKTGIAFCEAGLKANPDDPMLLNNLIYIHLTFDEYEKAEKFIPHFFRIEFKNLDDEMKVMVQATFGLIALRKNEIDLGIKAYKNAIEMAEKMKSPYKKGIATVNFAKELIRANHELKSEYIKAVKNMKPSLNNPDLIHLQREALKFFSSRGL